MSEKQTLPGEFNDLEIWCDSWCHSNTNDRNAARYAHSMDQINAFYDALLPRAEAALDYLSQFQLGELPEDAQHLMHLMLSLAEIGPAVEWFGQPQVIDGYDPLDFPLVLPLSDIGAQ